MVRIVRESKFRHIFGQPAPKDQQFEGVCASNTRLDANLCACNSKFIAVVLNSSGAGVFTVLDSSKPGRFDVVPKCMGHNSEVLDLSFDPFNPNRIVSGSDDGSFIVWWIPDGGLTEDMSEYLAVLKPSQRRAVQSVWHTCASDVLFTAHVDSISIFELVGYTCVRTINTSTYSDQLYNISLNSESSKIACVFKDKHVRVIDTQSGNVDVQFPAYDGAKPSRVCYLHGIGEYVCVTFFSKMSERRIAIWDLKNTGSPVVNQDIDKGVAVLNIHYDSDLSLLTVFSKGESSVRIFELDTSAHIFLVSTFQQGEQQKTGCFADKLSCNTATNEVMHFLKVTSKGSEPVSFIVPRKSDLFQEDLFPDTNSNIAAMSAAQFVAGEKPVPKKISMRDFFVTTGAAMPEKQSVTVQVNAGALGGARTSSAMVSHQELAAKVARMEEQIKAINEKLGL